MINDYDPDIVNLHWVAGNMLSVNDIRKIKAPIVWTIHDHWPFSNGIPCTFISFGWYE